jgi:hypothetical protein
MVDIAVRVVLFLPYSLVSVEIVLADREVGGRGPLWNYVVSWRPCLLPVSDLLMPGNDWSDSAPLVISQPYVNLLS